MQSIEEIERAWTVGSPRQVEAARLRDDEGLYYREIGVRLGGITKQRAQQLVELGRRFRQPVTQVQAVEAARLRDDEGLSYKEIGIRLGGITGWRAAELVELGRAPTVAGGSRRTS